MDYEPVETTADPPDTLESRFRRQKRAIYACFTVVVIAKVLVLCWIVTMSIPLDPLGSLFRGEWWGGKRNLK